MYYTDAHPWTSHLTTDLLLGQYGAPIKICPAAVDTSQSVCPRVGQPWRNRLVLVGVLLHTRDLL